MYLFFHRFQSTFVFKLAHCWLFSTFGHVCVLNILCFLTTPIVCYCTQEPFCNYLIENTQQFEIVIILFGYDKLLYASTKKILLQWDS